MWNSFPLKKLEKTFSIASFERQLKKRHVNRILRSMVESKFYDNVFRVIKRVTGQFEVIDGQHRIEALARLRDDYDVSTYDIVLQIFEPTYARDIYRRLNWGRPLTLRDHLKALDNGKNIFFVNLRGHYGHYGKDGLPRYEMIFNALHYAKNGSPRAVRALLVDRMSANVTHGDMLTILDYTRAIKKVEPNIYSKLYKYTIYRNMFRVGYENSFDQNKWEQLIRLCKSDPVIEELYSRRTASAVKRIYSYIIDQLGPRLNLELKKIDRTPSQAKLVLDRGPIFGSR